MLKPSAGQERGSRWLVMARNFLCYVRQHSERMAAFRNSVDVDVVKCNIAITDHMRLGRCEAALDVFNSMRKRSSVSYNAMISGYISNGNFYLARSMFERMPQRDLISWNVMLSGYIKNNDLSAARAFFETMPERDVVSWNSMLSGYAQNGMVDKVKQVFYAMPERNNISWNALLSTYVQNGMMDEAKRLFDSRSQWNLSSWNCLMGGFARKKKLEEAMHLFEIMPERDGISWNIMVTAFAQNGEVSKARRLFEQSPVRDVFTWTAMVSCYAQNGLLDDARYIFDQIPDKNAVSWNAMIAGYVQHQKMDKARELFDMMPCRNTSSWNVMITGYANAGHISYARDLFDNMPQRDCISRAAIISGYTHCGLSEEALCLFVLLMKNGKSMNRSTFATTLAACANIAALELGRQIHSFLCKSGYEMGCFIGNALLAMYFRCGAIDEARDMFYQISWKDVVSWNTMIYGYARHGFGEEALDVFESMKVNGVKPNDTTMVGVLAACGHAGLIDKGTEYFNSMKELYGITVTHAHFSCMVDLLGRAGKLEEAQHIIKTMSLTPDAAVWGALLGASRIHGNVGVGEKAAEVILEMEPENSGMYVLLSNIYAASGRWQDVSKLRLKMKDRGVKKVLGHSWLEAQNKIHVFAAGDSCHPEKEKIYAFLEDIESKMKLQGYISSTNLVLHDVEEEEKEQLLKFHSEKLAVAYGVISTPYGRPIRVIKNLRVCEDCHNAIKYISKIVGRLIILRDSNRFHHFKEGTCSCGDYW